MQALAVSGVKNTDWAGFAISSAEADDPIDLGAANFETVKASLEAAISARRKKALRNFMMNRIY